MRSRSAFPCAWSGGALPALGSWVAIAGTWDVAEVRGERRAVIVPTTVAPTERPEQPYLY